jgi:hypothetical protein
MITKKKKQKKKKSSCVDVVVVGSPHFSRSCSCCRQSFTEAQITAADIFLYSLQNCLLGKMWALILAFSAFMASSARLSSVAQQFSSTNINCPCDRLELVSDNPTVQELQSAILGVYKRSSQALS